MRFVRTLNWLETHRRSPIGSYSELHLGPLYVGGDKGGINPLVMMVFRESDKRIERISRDGPEWPELTEGNDELGVFETVRYVAPAFAIRDRLELLGFTLRASIRAFEAATRIQVERHASTMASLASSLPRGDLDTDAEVLATLTAANWMDGLRQIARLGLRPSHSSEVALESLPPLLQFMLRTHWDGWYGFEGGDVRHVIRLAVEVLPDDELEYDLTDLVLGGYYDSTDDVVADAEYLLTEDFAVARRVVVLTEGSADKWILERSLKLLYPHLADFYTFMDFAGARVAGGAPALAGMVKAFVGAGILNRVVALFDNDTAGASAMRLLAPIRMPRNIVAFQYPPLPSAREYPTIGPTGDALMDVNGLACSIELYLGVDVLLVDGKLTPVEWKGLDEGSRRYQGGVLGKSQIHHRFAAKLARCESHPEHTTDYDWDGIRLILRRLQSAFHETDEESLVAAEESGT